MIRGIVLVLCSAVVTMWIGLAFAIPVANGSFDSGSQANCSDALISWTVAGNGISGDAVFPHSAPCDASFASTVARQSG